MSRDTRDPMSDDDSALVALSVDTSRLALRLFMVQKSSIELSQNQLKTAWTANFKVEYFENEMEIRKSGLTDFRYCPIDS